MSAHLRLAMLEQQLDSDAHPPAYPDFAGTPPEHHMPVDLCGFAACTAGTYHRRLETIPAESPSVLLLLDNKLSRCLRALLELQGAGKTVVVTPAEAGTMQLADLLDQPEELRDFFQICQRADAAIAATPEGVPVFRGAGARHVEFIPTPCPVDDPRWNFSVPAERRRGILVGTSEFCTRYRNHVAALLSLRDLAAATGEPVTVVRGRRRYDRRMVEQLQRHWPAGLLRVVDGPLPALQFVRLMAGHKLVFQLDQAGAVGQVAAEALLCRIPCVGGYGATERLAFPTLCGFGRNTGQLVELAARLVAEPAAADAAVSGALALAAERLSFEVVRSRLTSLYARARSRAHSRSQPTSAA